MPLLTKTRAAQYPLSQEFIFNFGDTIVDTGGVTKDFKSVATIAAFIFQMPQGAMVKGGDIIVETAYAGPTAATLSIGDTGSATKYANAVNLLAAARTALTIPVTPTGGLDVTMTLALTVAAATAGRVRVRIEYTIDNRVNEPS